MVTSIMDKCVTWTRLSKRKCKWPGGRRRERLGQGCHSEWEFPLVSSCGWSRLPGSFSKGKNEVPLTTDQLSLITVTDKSSVTKPLLPEDPTSLWLSVPILFVQQLQTSTKCPFTETLPVRKDLLRPFPSLHAVYRQRLNSQENSQAASLGPRNKEACSQCTKNSGIPRSRQCMFKCHWGAFNVPATSYQQKCFQEPTPPSL